MANVTRVRVVQKYQLSDRASKEEKERAFKGLFTAFKRQVTDAGILHLCKKYERYEKPSEKRHRKKKEKNLERIKALRGTDPRSKKKK